MTDTRGPSPTNPELESLIRAAWRDALDSAANDVEAPPIQAPSAQEAADRLAMRLRAMDASAQAPHNRLVNSASRRASRGAPPRAWPRMAFATMAGIAIVAGVLFRYSSTLASRDLHSSTAAHRYTTASGQQQRVQLADGSVVILAPQSVLTVAEHFGAVARDVTLRGEAYFEIHSAAGAPFVVHTNGVQTRVMGTAFAVRHYPEDPAVRIAVVSGRVMAGGRYAPVVVSAGTTAQVTDSTITTTPGTAALYTGWTAGELTFDEVPAPAMLATVGRWYGYHFRLTDSAVAAQHVAATFRIAARAETMSAIADLLDVTMTFDDTVVTLSPRHRHQTPIRHSPSPMMPLTSEVGK